MKNTTFNYKRLLDQREKFKWSQFDLSLRLNEAGVDVTPSTVSNWERGESSPDAEILGKVAQVLKLSVDELYL